MYELQPVCDIAFKHLVEPSEVISAGAFSGIERYVTPAERRFIVGAAVEAGQPNRRRYLNLRALYQHWDAKRVEHRLGNVLSDFGGSTWQNDGELIPSCAGAARVRRRRLARRLRDQAKYFVASEVAVKIVDALE